MSNSSDQNADVEKDLAELSQSRILQLRQRWRQLFRTDPPVAFGPDLLRRSIAQKLQEQAFGGIAPSVQLEIERIIRLLEGKPNARIELPRRIKTGAILVRGWKGKTHRVTILDDGYAYDGKNYNNLSEIARRITGTRWNGPRFFGLRTNTTKEVSNVS
jgi:hypothetical protein